MWIDDQIIKSCRDQVSLNCFIPSETVVVLGSSNDPSTECYVENCEQDGVKILRRYGGGGAVVLHPGCVIVSLGAWVKDYFQNPHYFKLLNQILIAALERSWPSLKGLEQKGLSDIAMGDRKIAGTSLFRSRHYLLYQASILVESRVDLLERYLRHPSKEPDYRQKRSHQDFVVGLNEIEATLSPKLILDLFERDGIMIGRELLGEELINPDLDHIEYLMKRTKSGQS